MTEGERGMEDSSNKGCCSKRALGIVEAAGKEDSLEGKRKRLGNIQ
jgi:hypothetical protein